MSFEFERALNAPDNLSENENGNSSYGERTLNVASILSIIQGRVFIK